MAKGIRLGELGRRDVLRAALIGLGGGIIGFGAGPVNEAAAATPTSVGSRILVVVELSGANDGLNTIVPYTNDAYYRARPKLGLKPEKLRRLDDQFGVQSGMAGFERLFKDGQLAIVHGVGYENPSFSHFTSMAYWQTGAPNSGDPYGWLGRLADSLDPSGADSYIVDVEARQSLAVRARAHVPLTFFQPDRFKRDATYDEKSALDQLAGPRTARNGAEAFLFDVAASAERAEVHVREACAAYRTPVDYGLVRFRARSGCGLDRGRLPDANLLCLLSAQRVRHPCEPGGQSRPAADLYVRPYRGVPCRHGAHRTRSGCHRHGVQRVRPARRRERQSGHRSRNGRPELHPGPAVRGGHYGACPT